ncbi:MAG: hypothetical protein KF760_13025 [Candidatus Eremiobacteraeota bacterium]|nr:hypothetical protein [Candidatus Eremiobacteraeota bacterium]MCW5870395.1 hypothetical protein [Candidatus Eremiobacteraeota bacterium]
MRVWWLLCLLMMPAWGERWPEALVQRLEAQPIRAAQSLESYLTSQGRSPARSHGLWLLELRDGTRAVFRSEEVPSGSQAEIAGYRFTRWLGLELVPPSAFRTLHESEWPAGSRWPFASSLRTGSLQLYVNTEKISTVNVLDQADIEVVSFVMGRYHNPAANLLMDEQGQPCVVGFENSLEIQQARYGQFPYAMRGQRRTDIPGLSALKPFPFEHPQMLVDPSLEQVQKTFSPWWVFEPEGMSELLGEALGMPDKTVRYVVWDSHLWVQTGASFRHPACTEVYRESTMQRLGQLDATTLQQLLPMPYTQEHVRGMLERTRQVLEDWKS